MKQFIERSWMPFAGGGTALSFKGISELTTQTPKIMDTTQQLIAVTTHEPMIRYFWIGVLGAVGGLLVKIIWMCIKRWVPFFKKLDNEKTTR